MLKASVLRRTRPLYIGLDDSCAQRIIANAIAGRRVFTKRCVLNFWRAAFFVLVVSCLCSPGASAQWRVRVKSLGGTPTSFSSSPLTEPDDLRRLIASHLPEIKKILGQKGSGWTGSIKDLQRAAQFACIKTVTVGVGKRIPWMAMRRHGRPRIYKPASGMIWDGSAPMEAYSIEFVSNGRAWTLIVPKACGNFWIAPEPLTAQTRKRIVDCLDCFHENQEIQFSGPDSVYHRDGLIMHDGGDFGDTAQREGWYWLGVWIRSKTDQPWVDNPPRTLSF